MLKRILQNWMAVGPVDHLFVGSLAAPIFPSLFHVHVPIVDDQWSSPEFAALSQFLVNVPNVAGGLDL